MPVGLRDSSTPLLPGRSGSGHFFDYFDTPARLPTSTSEPSSHSSIHTSEAPQSTALPCSETNHGSPAPSQ